MMNIGCRWDENEVMILWQKTEHLSMIHEAKSLAELDFKARNAITVKKLQLLI